MTVGNANKNLAYHNALSDKHRYNKTTKETVEITLSIVVHTDTIKKRSDKNIFERVKGKQLAVACSSVNLC